MKKCKLFLVFIVTVSVIIWSCSVQKKYTIYDVRERFLFNHFRTLSGIDDALLLKINTYNSDRDRYKTYVIDVTNLFNTFCKKYKSLYSLNNYFNSCKKEFIDSFKHILVYDKVVNVTDSIENVYEQIAEFSRDGISTFRINSNKAINFVSGESYIEKLSTEQQDMIIGLMNDGNYFYLMEGLLFLVDKDGLIQKYGKNYDTFQRDPNTGERLYE